MERNRISDILFAPVLGRVAADIKAEREAVDKRFASLSESGGLDVKALMEAFETRLAAERTAMEERFAGELADMRRAMAELESRVTDGDCASVETVYNSVRKTTSESHPNITPLSEVLRDIAALRWNVKLLGAEIARRLYDQGYAGSLAPLPEAPTRVGLTSKLCRQEDIEADWLRHWCGRLRVTPLYSRKIWELGFVIQAIWEAGLLEPGRSGLGFAVGAESIPAFLAAQGVEVLATDLAAEDDRSAGWRDSNQHADNLDPLFRADYLDRASFDRLCRFRPVDMNAIPDDLAGQFDFCWSMCSFEHVGSIELGLQFIENSVKCLKPGGLAVHTTEFSFEPTDETIDNWPTVLFQERHIAVLRDRLAAAGHKLYEVDFSPGDKVLDQFIDTPPYDGHGAPKLAFPEPAHLRLNVDGFACTSLGLIVKAAGG